MPKRQKCQTGRDVKRAAIPNWQQCRTRSNAKRRTMPNAQQCETSRSAFSRPPRVVEFLKVPWDGFGQAHRPSDVSTRGAAKAVTFRDSPRVSDELSSLEVKGASALLTTLTGERGRRDSSMCAWETPLSGAPAGRSRLARDTLYRGAGATVAEPARGISGCSGFVCDEHLRTSCRQQCVFV